MYCFFDLYARWRSGGRPVPAPVYRSMTVALPWVGFSSPATIEVLVLPDGVPGSAAPADLTRAGWVEVRHPGLSVLMRTARDFLSKHRVLPGAG